METRLPDELIKEILSPALKVSDEAFLATDLRSPFATYQLSTSSLLLVCKSWLRVATPLLYNIVILRSRAQAQALEKALKSNKDLGVWIKKIRVEGGYGSAMFTILKNAPKLTDLWLTLCLHSADSVSGLCRALPLINPLRLILQDTHRGGTNASVRQLSEGLAGSLKKWDKLEAFDFPYSSHYRERVLILAEALAEAPNIKTIYLANSGYAVQPALQIFARNRSLQKICVPADDPSNPYWPRPLSPFDRFVHEDEKLRKLVVYTGRILPKVVSAYERSESPDTIPLSTNVNTAPLMSVSDSIKEVIWQRVLYYAMFVEDFSDEVNGKRLSSESVQQARRQLVLVSRVFHRLGLPYLYQSPVLFREGHVASLADSLTQNTLLGQHIQNLFLVVSHSSTVSKHIRAIFLNSPNLVRVGTPFRKFFDGEIEHVQGSSVDWKCFTALSETAGKSLVEFVLAIHHTNTLRSPKPLYVLPKLRILRWETQTNLNFRPSDVPSGALVSLEELTCIASNTDFLHLLSCMDLPAIRRVFLPSPDKMDGIDKFLLKHGHKLTSLEMGFAIYPPIPLFDLCPALTALVFPPQRSSQPHKGYFSCATDHRALTHVTVTTASVSRTQERQTFRWLGELDLNRFKALREICVFRCQWPTSEREISKSPWVEWAEHLLQWDVKLTDKAGKAWTPRLKATKGRRAAGRQ